MDTALIEILKAIPVAGIMIYLVIIFLKEMGKRDVLLEGMQKGWAVAMEKRDDRLDSIHDSWSKSMVISINRVTETIESNTRALIDAKVILAKLEERPTKGKASTDTGP